VFSTVGDPRVFERLPQQHCAACAGPVAAHHQAGLARANCCRARRVLRRSIWCRLGETYARATGYPIQYQWTLLEGVNDGDDEIEGIVALLSGPCSSWK
jgi:23S rRNA (adenine2503-C2)-methyltransferase